ncbi:MAG: hypothetical protein Q9157_005931 [Trypethelium eluteriae]
MSTDLGYVRSTEEMRPKEFDMLSLEELPNVRIISSTALPLDTPYFTLSHRWGTPPGILLNKETEYLLNDDITPHLLRCSEAAVFRHAIHVTRSLGFRYIWIDALCIMQDDGPEKTGEIMQMDQIYMNSTLNISATEAQSRNGLVFDRESLPTNPCRAIVRVFEIQTDICLQAFSENHFLASSEGLLNKRGWVFQERTLAPRIVHFTKDQVFWECHSLDASEVLPRGISDSRPPRPKKGVETSPTLTIQQVKLRWYELVEDYSGTSLTFADDRLLAISAIAKQCCLRMRLDPSEYLAGMWKNDLPLSLIWGDLDRGLGADKSRPTIGAKMEMKHAPSWSWASVLTEVMFCRFPSLVAKAEVLGVEIKRISPNFFGGTEFCRLRLRGRICKFRRHVHDDVPWIYIGQRSRFQEVRRIRSTQDNPIVIDWDISRRVVSDLLDTDGSTPAASTYALFQIASVHDEIELLVERGIILQRIAAHGTYLRIGCFFTRWVGGYLGSELEVVFKGHFKTLSAGDYLDLDSGGKYTIDVV